MPTTPAPEAYVVLVYVDNGDPDIYGPFARPGEAREALERLRPKYEGDDSVQDFAVHKLRQVPAWTAPRSQRGYR